MIGKTWGSTERESYQVDRVPVPALKSSTAKNALGREVIYQNSVC